MSTQVRVSSATLITLLALAALPRPSFAHRDDYLDETLVYLTLEQGEVEPEYWFDQGLGSRRAGFTRHSAALEYGIRNHWMADGRLTAREGPDDRVVFESGRLESRYRFSEESTLPIDVALSAEVNLERGEEGSTEASIEPRLILSKDPRETLNLTLNLSEEVAVGSGHPAFHFDSGWRYSLSGLFRIGSEVRYDARAHSGLLIPQVWFTLAHDVTVKVGYSRGFDRNKEDFLRTALEIEL